MSEKGVERERDEGQCSEAESDMEAAQPTDQEEEDWDSDESSGEEGSSGEEDDSESGGDGGTLSSGDSGNDDEVDKCPICLKSLREQHIGMPESCDHDFCLECIVEWSKNVNTCPVDRKIFHIILAKHGVDNVVYKKIPVEDKKLAAEPEAADEVIHCEVCRHGDREDELLLCDGCDLGYHLDCLTPALGRVPMGDWYCADCRFTAPHTQDIGRLHGAHIPRTLMMERLLNLIAPERAARRQRVIYSSTEDEDEFQDFDFLDDPSISRTAASTSTGTTTPRKVSTRRKRRRKARRKSSKTLSKTKNGTGKTASGTRRRKSGRRKKKKVPTATLR